MHAALVGERTGAVLAKTVQFVYLVYTPHDEKRIYKSALICINEHINVAIIVLIMF